MSHDGLEAIWFDLLLPKTKPIVVGTVYRPPDQNGFLDLFEGTLNKVRSDLELIILGDFNINFKNFTSSIQRNYVDILKLFGINQLIKDHTRVTKKSSTIIDHVLCNTRQKISQSGVIPVGVSDHYLTFCTRKTIKGQIGVHNVVKVRSLKNYSVSSLIFELSQVDWTELS